MIYELYSTSIPAGAANAVMTVGATPQVSFIFDPENSDYQNFKYQINHDESQLEDADGVLMTPEEAKAYVATLP